jgi:hypothetical protein
MPPPRGLKSELDIEALTALYPVVKEILRRLPRLRAWLEDGVKKNDPAFWLQVEFLEAIDESRDAHSRQLEALGLLRNHIMTASIMSAMLANPSLTADKVKERFIESAEVARDIRSAIEEVSP